MPSHDPEQQEAVPQEQPVEASLLAAESEHPQHVLDTSEVGTHPRSPSVATYAGALVVIAAWIVLELWGLGAAPFHTKGEPREALVVWEMTHGGSWVLPKRNGTELPSKPPLFHWLGAVTSLIGGSTDEWSIRFPSALLSLLGALGVLAAAAALWTPAAGVAAALSLLTTFEWARAATNARVDMTLTVGLEAAFLGFLFFHRSRRPRWLVLLYLGITFAALGKGPVGIVLPGVVALLTVVVTRDFSLLRQMRLVSGGLAVLVATGAWYILALQMGGYDFFQKQILNENLLRFLGGPQFSGGHRHSNLTLFGLLLLGLMPWTLFLPSVAAGLWRNRRALSFRDGTLYCLAWTFAVCLLYAFAASKRSVYLLATYPALALLLGWWIATTTSSVSAWRNRLLGGLGIVAGAVVGLLLAIIVVHLVGIPLVNLVAEALSPRDRGNLLAVSAAMESDPRLVLGCIGSAAAALLGFGVACWRGRPWFAHGSMFVASATLIVFIRLVALPAVAWHETLRAFMTEVRAAAGPADATFFYRTFDYGAVFYSHGHLPTYDGSFPTGAPRFLLLSCSEWEELRARAINQYQQVRLPSDPRRLVLVQRVGE